ncbi:O-antigen ligase family protein [Magnetospirillum gryphiswaldense]|uniref:Lipid A core-O-antigen ligase and related enzymes n=1 Tax=Magnetospirillum gryphiswaldense TaxID=55518 RepID=A4U2U1_9PROT|nr:O-antigen ligase family protein [Magnetospirillum gryphiswaldense]AVM75612.1 O-Antigen ligase [Magnetospirillum gryphiswaldense MSR-1]AVM79515.1 O-Antigen ligase [Magnetospirillum gryphiswaldense]CAM77198.1 Lipid A core-O-antigen ligase and related enzymes [Magnetospirillum gryphiswaldense MSR-1]
MTPILSAVTAHRLFFGLFVLCAALTPVLAIVAPLGLAPLAALIMLAALWVYFIDGKPMHFGAIGWALTGLGLWAAISAAWSPDLGQGLKSAGRVFIFSLGGLALYTVAARSSPLAGKVATVLVVAFVLALAAMAFEYISGNKLALTLAHLKGEDGLVGLKSPLNRGVTVLMLLQWPVFLVVSRRFGRWVGLACLALTLSIVFLGDSMSAKVSALVGMAMFVLVLLLPRLGLRVLMVGVVALFVTFPIAAYRLPPPEVSFREWLWLPLSSHHRLTIWGFVGERIAEKPLLGWGMDASRAIPGGETEIKVQRPNYTNRGQPMFEMSEQLLPLHPHNSVLQIWLELGVLGAVAVCGAIVLMLRAVAASPWAASEKAAAAALFGVGLTISSISYGFWQSWWQAALWLSVALFAAALARSRL